MVVVASATTMAADLTPFGFTTTESLVYTTLLRLGPVTGYAVARAAHPQALLTQITAAHGEALDRLNRALADAARSTEPETRTLVGARAVANVVLQLVARAERRVQGVLAAELWRPTLPAWRRAATRAQVELRIAGDRPAEAPELVTGTTPPDHPTVLVIDETQALAAVGSAEGLAAVWTSHPAIVALARGALGGAP